MLKKVLKEYCAPIPEEIEEVTPNEDKKPANSSTNVVMVMNTVNNSQSPTLEAVKSKIEYERQGSNGAGDVPRRPESPGAVSPFTKG